MPTRRRFSPPSAQFDRNKFPAPKNQCDPRYLWFKNPFSFNLEMVADLAAGLAFSYSVAN
jgi:hypothetical protein